MSEIYLAGGCFWGLEKYLGEIRGVLSTEVGYANGLTERPTYEAVCRHGTGHAETVRVTFDPSVLPLDFLLSLFYEAIDPVSVNRQGNDVGTQYRTGIYYVNPDDRPIIEDSLARLQQRLDEPLAIQARPLENYFPAETYHQKYLDKNPGGYCHIGRDKFAKAAQSVVNPAAYAAQSPDRLRQSLSDMAFKVTQTGATEPPFLNAFHDHFRPGIYVDVTTGEPLFSSSDKFASGCGWPSFSKPIDPGVISQIEDLSHGMRRTEVKSRVGDAHLGHVFDDGPRETGGQRYCINSASLRFIPKEDMASQGYAYLLHLV